MPFSWHTGCVRCLQVELTRGRHGGEGEGERAGAGAAGVQPLTPGAQITLCPPDGDCEAMRSSCAAVVSCTRVRSAARRSCRSSTSCRITTWCRRFCGRAVWNTCPESVRSDLTLSLGDNFSAYGCGRISRISDGPCRRMTQKNEGHDARQHPRKALRRWTRAIGQPAHAGGAGSSCRADGSVGRASVWKPAASGAHRLGWGLMNARGAGAADGPAWQIPLDRADIPKKAIASNSWPDCIVCVLIFF